MKTKAAKSRESSESRAADPRFSAVIDAFASDDRVTCRTLMASIGLTVKGKIFAMLVRGRLVVKLPKQRVDELVRAHDGEYFDPRRDGRLMKEWFVSTNPRQPWVDLAREACRYVRSKA